MELEPTLAELVLVDVEREAALLRFGWDPSTGRDLLLKKPTEKKINEYEKKINEYEKKIDDDEKKIDDNGRKTAVPRKNATMNPDFVTNQSESQSYM